VVKKRAASTSPRPSGPKKWTFMVYMVAGQSRDLDAVAVRDLREMERGCEGNDNVNVVVQLDRHWPSGAQRYEVQGNGSRLIRQLPGNTNMGAGKTLTDFVKMVAKSKKYRAENYCLILWGHAFGLGFGRDHDDPLVLSELKKALGKFRDVRKYKRAGTNGRLEILGTNSCSMSYAEAAFQLRDSAQLMIASQITAPFTGWPYDVILRRIDRSTDAEELSRLVVDAYVNQFNDLPGGDRLAMSVLNLPGAENLDKALEALAQEIDAEIVSSGFASETMGLLRDLFMGSAAGDVRPLIDLTTLLRSLAPEDGEPPLSDKIASKAQELFDMLHVGTKERGKLIDWHNAHPDIRADLHGIGIYAPFLTDKGIVGRLGLSDGPAGDGRRKPLNGRQQYERLELFPNRDKAAWPRLVYDGLRRTIPADLIFAIDGVAELQTGDRADVAQIIMSIEAGFNQFDRSVETARRRVKATLDYPAPAAVRRGRSGTTAQPVRSFSAPWLRLIGPVPIEALQQAEAIKKLVAPVKGQAQVRAGANAVASNLASSSSTIVAHLTRVEKALSHVERVTRRGITHARFGLGLLSPTPGGFGLEPGKAGGGLEPGKAGGGLEPGKAGGGLEPGKAGGGLEPGKAGGGLEPGKAGGGLPSGFLTGDLSVDLALVRVANLFSEVGSALEMVERATLNVETIARDLLVVSPPPAATAEEARAAAEQTIGDAFLLLQEASSGARRTIRRALAHPIYGLGPGEGSLTFEVRQDLASRGGLDRRSLRLL